MHGIGQHLDPAPRLDGGTMRMMAGTQTGFFSPAKLRCAWSECSKKVRSSPLMEPGLPHASTPYVCTVVRLMQIWAPKGSVKRLGQKALAPLDLMAGHRHRRRPPSRRHGGSRRPGACSEQAYGTAGSPCSVEIGPLCQPQQNCAAGSGANFCPPMARAAIAKANRSALMLRRR